MAPARTSPLPEVPSPEWPVGDLSQRVDPRHRRRNLDNRRPDASECEVGNGPGLTVPSSGSSIVRPRAAAPPRREFGVKIMPVRQRSATSRSPAASTPERERVEDHARLVAEPARLRLHRRHFVTSGSSNPSPMRTASASATGRSPTIVPTTAPADTPGPSRVTANGQREAQWIAIRHGHRKHPGTDAQ